MKQNGFTMIEVLIAMVILGITLLGTQAMFTDQFIRAAGNHDKQAIALQLAKERVELIQASGVYRDLDTYQKMESIYGETATSVPDHPEFTRTTRIKRSNAKTKGTLIDFKQVTVTVNGPGLLQPISRSISVGAP